MQREWELISCTFILFILVVQCQEDPPISNKLEDITNAPPHHHHHHHHHHKSRVQRLRTPICVNGKAVDGACHCDLDFVGKHCEKQKHCESYRRFRNGSCPACKKGYDGTFCEDIVCVNGSADKHKNFCTCNKPFSGKHCDELETKHIYSYYNQKVFLLGPLGAISLIPMCALYAGCEYFAKKRQVKRVEAMMSGQNIPVGNKTLKKLLDDV
ncbi:unnamed protein product [Caenorhabditis bovis]|uniref:EGF-like domain-containing protein n=1 Tax=Caenorhabditis bovis TaxID=2654633 RepID=A0A8S1EG45_9PELO|nr:unnamed protein product [Caenorhabditis bovis]